MDSAAKKALLVNLTKAVNDTSALPVTVKFEFLEADAPAASLQQLPGERWASRYLDGSGVREIPFAVWYRTKSNDTSGRADAAVALQDIADSLESASPISGLGRIEGLDTPSMQERTDDGIETWMCNFVLKSEVQTAAQ
jgi:hypothetical protein